MSEKPTKQSTDDAEFSLNHLDLGHEEMGTDDENAFNHLIQEGDHPFEDQKQEPIVPDAFDGERYDMADEEDFDTIKSPLFEDDSIPNANMDMQGLDVGHLGQEDEFLEQQPAQTSFASNVMFKFVLIAIVIVAVVVWLNTGKDEDDGLANDLSIEQQALENEYPAIQSQSPMPESIAAQSIAAQPIIAQPIIAQPIIAQPIQPHVITEQPKLAHVEKRHQNSVQKDKQKKINAWAVIIASVNSRASALKSVAQFKAKGIAAEVRPIILKGKAWYRISVGGFANRQEAEAQKAYLARKYGMKGTWIYKPE